MCSSLPLKRAVTLSPQRLAFRNHLRGTWYTKELVSKIDFYLPGLRKGVSRPQPVSRGFMAYMRVGLFQLLYSFPCGGHTLCCLISLFSWVPCLWDRVGFCAVCSCDGGGFCRYPNPAEWSESLLCCQVCQGAQAENMERLRGSHC